MIASKVICDDTYSNKSWSIVGQGMFQLREINQMEREMCQYLDWELNVNVEPGTLKEFEDMVRKDFAGPGPYPTYVLQTISKLAATSSNPFPAIALNNSTSPIPSFGPRHASPPKPTPPPPQSHHHQNPALLAATGKFGICIPQCPLRTLINHDRCSWSPSIVGHPTGFLTHSNIIL